MERKRRLSQIGRLTAIAGLLVAAVTALRMPEGWLVRAQLRAAVGGRLTGWVDDQSLAGRKKERAREARLAARNPDDFPLQMAVALRNVPPNGVNLPPSDHALPLDELSGQEARIGSAAALRLRGLTKRFNDRPELHATILRYMARGDVGLSDRRGEQNALSATDPTAPSTAPNCNSPRALLDWDDACYQGERLDPTNAFFPAMRAIGFYARHDDARAEDELFRAERLTDYDDYLGTEPAAQWHLMALMGGGAHGTEPGAIPRLSEYAAVCFWHYAPLRQLARLTTARAMQAELRGDKARGFRLRHAVARLGATMRASGHGSFISPRVGIAITETATLRPGGAPALIDEDTGKRREKRHAAYTAYLLRTGHGDEARFVQWEADARTQVDAIYHAAEALPGNETDLLFFGRLCAAWAVGIGLLTNAFVITLAGGLAVLYCRVLPRVERFRRASPRNKGVWIAAHVIGFLAVGAGLFGLGRCGGAFTASGFGYGLTGILSGVHNETGLCCALFADGAASVVGALVPLIAVLALWSRRKQIPVGVGIARGLTKCAVPALLGLLVLYAVVAWWTMGEEAARTVQLQRSVQGEGTYYAERVGKPWPGVYKQNKPVQGTNQ